MQSLIGAPPFVDGNTRTGLATTGLFLELNGHTLTATDDEVLDSTRRVVAGQVTLQEMAACLEAHSQPVRSD